ncbi:regulatory protein YycI of two-component signal transduction system YycFG [Ureibacillus xyleni]|uniref:Regulatory protein YycI of two-component signal transduction system YycFG n=1 Tax=Ureibacillus xyleni TaxID=614648 RepID=A0A285SQ13_9BACL|nr:two-component system regulatory protein YycI [Ureibacillus xyleni]SOC08208.1 regulatory protein YycI of two-component signal transduction system YycFG [Ureibacillus xyleni]
MDWSKSKSIFIVVFLILNVFLYSLYLNRHTEAQLVEVLGEKTIEAQLQDDNITYGVLPTNIEKAAYISATVKNFEEENIVIQNAQSIIVENKNKLIVTLKEPVKISNLDQEENYRNFLQFQVYEGASYSLWKVDPENGKVTFFQRLNDRKIYYNINGVLTIFLNDKNEIIGYEQTLLDNIEEYNKEKTLLPPIQVIQALYGKRLLKPDSKITEMKLGYSTLVQLKTQVFVPTWEVRATTQDNIHEEYFVNAVEGKVIDVQLDATRVEAVETEVEDVKEVDEE